ncbi:hypothetical protein K440DRAFT_11855 [Wilcoxina mikolae CBS 423.85]|nr:hypothetical protein K440DRAFT_11855 [Wilcoxina mikolae CBS 423.85]
MARFTKLSATAILLTLVLNFLVAHGAATAGPGTLIFARQNPGCAVCGVTPVCECLATQRCELTAQTCSECPKMLCKDIAPPQPKVSGGAIAGACVGGLLGAGILAFVVHKLCATKRSDRASMVASGAEKENDFGMLKSARASTHTVASIASTVRTRASNVIQIAYIPGVTNRSNPSSPGHLVPPVPPLPYTDSPTTPNIDIQFAADDLLRGSMYTVDNRSSVATTIYGGGAVVAQPNIIRAGKAAVVTVKGGSSVATSSTNSPIPESESVPPVPALFIGGPSTRKGAQSDLEPVPPSPAFSVGSTFLNRMNSKNESDTTMSEHPQKRAIPGRSRVIHENHSTSSFHYDSDDDSDLVPGHRGNLIQSQCSSCITAMDPCSPFSDVNSVVLDNIPLSNDSRLPLAENTETTSKQPVGKTRSSRVASLSKAAEPTRTVSPFDDSHSVEKSR